MNKLKYLLLACLTAGFLHTTEVVAASSNTLVRFQLRYGTTLFGNIDVELFDYDKPVTVSNFLHYVRSGAFNHTFLDYVQPGYFVKGGEYTVATPYSDALFEQVTTIPEGPAITNEFSTTRTNHNFAGTLAMSLSYEGEGTNATTIRDSATTSWFFNLWDNSSNDPSVDFDGQGFVVFGRVVKGMKYLNYFNTIWTNDYVLDMNGDDFLFSDCLFPSEGTNELSFTGLPIAYNLESGLGFRCPQYNDLFNVGISVLHATNVTDNASPKLALIHPTKSTITTNDSLTVRGTVSDAGSGLESVMIYLNNVLPFPATVSNNTFSAEMTGYSAGTNFLKVEATDENGNRTIVATTFFYEVKLPLDMLTISDNSGTGSFIGLTNQQMLTIGRVYSVTASPDPTNLFVAWYTTNDLANPISLQPTLRFFMSSNIAFRAKINTNFFRFVKGTYNGLFVTTNEVDPGGSGFVTLTLNDQGAYSMKVMFNGTTVPISGKFKSTMDVLSGFLNINTYSFRGVTYLPMQFDILTLADTLNGFVTNRFVVISNNVLVTNHLSVASLIADRAPTFTGTNTSPHAGKYTMTFPSDSNPGSPYGDGFGIVTVSPQGMVTLAASLADGTKVTQKVQLSKNGDWPLYLSPSKTNAALISWVKFTNEPASDFSGLFNWFKYRHNTKHFREGFTNEATIVGSRFLGPNTINQTLFLTNAIVGFTNGNLITDFTNHVGIAPNGKVTNQGSNKLSLSISSGNGLMSGSVTPPAGGKSVSFKGVVLQKQTNAAGYFLGTNASGRVQLSR